jgi:5-methylcytosine-specific restriction endonuclease McrA
MATRITTKHVETLWLSQKQLTELFGKAKAKDVTQIDHLTPVIQGGTHSISNLAIVHKQCNAEKHGKTLEEHWEWREKVGLNIPKRTSMEGTR